MRAAVLVLMGCGGAGAMPDAGPTDVFVAFSTHFQPFRSWESFHLDSAIDGGDVHVSAPRTEYLSARPPAGSTAFPVGTIIVKAMETTPAVTFAMVRRGGGYNAAGAVGWEWFELEETGSRVTIKWRGVGAPTGEMYGGDPTSCNACHLASSANDCVKSSALQLSGL